jgi:N-acetylglucosamine-6-phosphate deacetylase
MSSLLIHNATVYTPEYHPDCYWLLADHGKIIQLGGANEPIPHADNEFDATGMLLVPGFIDVHVHGAMGYETMDANLESLVSMSKFYAAHGVTSFLPTTWAVPMDVLLPVLQNVKTASETPHFGANILGAHIESSFICKAKAGAQNPDYIFPANPEMIQAIIDQQIVKILTLAPEIPENLNVIPKLVQAGIVVSAGHTCAGYDEIVLGVEKGITSTTHTFNAMEGLHHREPGGVGAALTIDDLYTEVIADNIHLHPAILKLISVVKPQDRLLLVTDAIRGTGLSDGVYPIDEQRKMIITNGIARLESGNLAGSTLTMERAIHNMMKASGKPLEKILPAVTSNPAALIGVAAQKGFLRPSYDADMVLLTPGLQVVKTFIAGVPV